MKTPSRKWLMSIAGVIWSWVTIQDGVARGWDHPSVWARACLAAVFFLQATIDPSAPSGFRETLRQPKGWATAALLIATITLMFAGRR